MRSAGGEKEWPSAFDRTLDVEEAQPMDELPVDKDTFVFTYPVFFLLNPAPPVSFVSSPLLEGAGGIGIHVFTDEDAADEYLAANPQPPGVIKHPAQNREKVVSLHVLIPWLAMLDKWKHEPPPETHRR
jgi:hypothetical protein